MTTNVKWPAGYEPEAVPIHAANTLDVKARPETVWKRIVDAEHWPDCYPHASAIEIAGNERVLGPGSRFTWKSMGMDIVSWVTVFEPLTRVGWMAELATDPDATAYHEWSLVPTTEGCRVTTEESQKGAFFEKLAVTHPTALHDVHQDWIEALGRVTEADERASRRRPIADPSPRTAMNPRRRRRDAGSEAYHRRDEHADAR